jgi:hypothetical protein
MRIPLVLVNRLLAGASNFDVLGNYLQTQIYNAMYEQWIDDVLLVDSTGVIIGSFGGKTAFQHLPHRSVVDNAKRYNLDIPQTPQCILCGNTKLAVCHRIPRAYGGNLSPHNLYLDCSLCNSKQRDVLTPAQLIALLPYAIHIPFYSKDMITYIKEVTHHEN